MKNFSWIIVLGASIFFSGLVFAQQGSIIDSQEGFYGTVFDTDSDVSMVVVKRALNEKEGTFKEVNCYVTDQTKIIKNGQVIGMDQLFPGDRVYVELEVTVEDQPAAFLIRVVSPEAE
ncbi:MAG: hypothetical protein P9M07_05735 [Candidatus Aceula meridiana]|nr:hypothetical protein [Candidatus Aceula meridiana]